MMSLYSPIRTAPTEPENIKKKTLDKPEKKVYYITYKINRLIWRDQYAKEKEQ